VAEGGHALLNECRSAPSAVRSTSAAAAGQYTPELARRGWAAVGIDYVPAAIEAAAPKLVIGSWTPQRGLRVVERE
jgi:hypothetical protein